MGKRFVLAFVAFVGLIVPGSFGLALLAAPAQPAPRDLPGCVGEMKHADLSIAASAARLRTVSAGDDAQLCRLTRLYFLEVVKARAVTALCKRGSERDRALGRFDANVTTLTTGSPRSAVNLCRQFAQRPSRAFHSFAQLGWHQASRT